MNTQALQRDITSMYLDALVQHSRESGVRIEDPGIMLTMAPSRHVLQLVGNAYLDASIPGIFQGHVQLARKLDGGGLRLDAEFKMAGKIVSVKTVNSKKTCQKHFKCVLACRGARGLYLAN